MTLIKTADAAEFLALVPRLAQCRPVRSVAVVPFDGSRTLGVLRVDLPEAGGDDGFAATLVGMVCKVREADAMAIVVYTDRPLAGTGPERGAIVHERLVRALERKAEACGLEIRETLCVASDGWGSYADAASPPVPNPLADLVDDDVVARLPVELRGPLGDQTAGVGLPRPDLAASERVDRALRSLTDAIGAVSGRPGRSRPRTATSPGSIRRRSRRCAPSTT